MADKPPRFPQERQTLILERLSRSGRVVAAELAQDFATSEDSIRRDLRELAKRGLCQRTYGGAILRSPASGTFSEREMLARDCKVSLARTAVTLIQPGQLVFLDAGTTTREIAHALPPDIRITVVTNAPAVALAAMEKPGVSVIMIGGVILPAAAAAIGARAIQDVKAMSIDLCFLGICAFSAELGLTGFNFEEAEFKKVLVEQSNVVVAALTSDKMETAAPFKIAPADVIDHLIVEEGTEPGLIKRLNKCGTVVHQSPSK